jgi:histidine kinase/DNA gyrase B/HSP90-like ATPase
LMYENYFHRQKPDNMDGEKELKLIIQPKVIDHLGIKMYQKPVDVLAEFVANAWDADSELVEIQIESDSITIQDFGSGMTYDQCQSYFLTVGRDRREATGKDVSEEKERPVLGRKGIGKFAGFGIASIVSIRTIAKVNGELTSFEMDIKSILEHDASDSTEKPIKVTEYSGDNDDRKSEHGTTIELKGVRTSDIDLNDFRTELSRRFLLAQLYDDFEIKVNGIELPESFSDQMEFVFPQDLTDEEKTKIPQLGSIENGWAIEQFEGNEIRWRMGFFEDTIQIEELRGISIFAKGKLSQKPFFFDLSGGISGQHGLEYMTGQVRMDFIDEGNNDLIATERQRINLQSELGKKIREWGIERIKLLSSFWKARRSKKRLELLNDRISGFRDRLDELPPRERNTVETVLRKIASFPRLGQARYKEWCNDVLTSWEKGRLRDLILEISETEDFDEQKLLDVLTESGILTALNIAEAIKTKIVTIGELKQRVASRQLENQVRDFIYDNPWLIHPQWETFKKERSVNNIIQDSGAKNLNDDAFNGRVDLALAAGSSLLLVEFMRPGLEIDRDHLDRINYYVIDIRIALKRETGITIQNLEKAFVIADSKKDSESISTRIAELAEKNILVMTWEGLIEQAIKQWEDHLELLKERYPDDQRIQDL